MELNTIKDIKLYTYKITNENFGEEFRFKKFLFDLQIEDRQKRFCIVFDEIPSLIKLIRFINRFKKHYKVIICKEEPYSEFSKDIFKHLLQFQKKLIEERKFRKIEKLDDYNSHKVFINDKRVYNTMLSFAINLQDSNEILIDICKIWNGPISSSYEIFRNYISRSNSSIVRFSDIQF